MDTSVSECHSTFRGKRNCLFFQLQKDTLRTCVAVHLSNGVGPLSAASSTLTFLSSTKVNSLEEERPWRRVSVRITSDFIFLKCQRNSQTVVAVHHNVVSLFLRALTLFSASLPRVKNTLEYLGFE